MLEEKLLKLYEEFKGLPSNKSIVRFNQKNDAFTILVADLVLKDYLEDDFSFTKHNINKISSFIVPPPDDSIDIFFEQEEADESFFHIFQVKFSKLTESEIESCFASMKRTVYSYMRSPKYVNMNLREIISNTSFTSSDDENCYYYVVHIGELNQTKKQKENEIIISRSHLETLMDSLRNLCVPKETIRIDEKSNYMLYANDKGLAAYLCNLNGYDLARISNEYISTHIGRNILFGQNLRDSLDKKSKTYKQMFDTIDNEPENFWYYNNGISIIAHRANIENVEYIDPITKETKKSEGAVLEGFSIVNGAQTASTLGAYLKEAELNRDTDKIKQLLNVHVLSRIVEIPKDGNELRNSIAIFNNTQNPITTRDMVSNREEQRRLYNILLNGEPSIFLEIRRGSKPPRNRSFLPHRKKITNEELAQLAFAAFLNSPYKAKDKKKTLFNNDYSKKWTINEDYHRIFNYSDEDKGVLFGKSNEEIDELLFIKQLHNDSKKYFRDIMRERLEQYKIKLEDSIDAGKPHIQNLIKLSIRNIEIVNVCLFYSIGLYYEFKANFDKQANAKYNAERYYEDREYKQALINAFIKVFLEKTIQVIRDLSGNINVNNWIRNPKNEIEFFNKLREDMALKIDYESEYQDFVEKFKA